MCQVGLRLLRPRLPRRKGAVTVTAAASRPHLIAICVSYRLGVCKGTDVEIESERGTHLAEKSRTNNAELLSFRG